MSGWLSAPKYPKLPFPLPLPVAAGTTKPCGFSCCPFFLFLWYTSPVLFIYAQTSPLTSSSIFYQSAARLLHSAVPSISTPLLKPFEKWRLDQATQTSQLATIKPTWIMLSIKRVSHLQPRRSSASEQFWSMPTKMRSSQPDIQWNYQEIVREIQAIPTRNTAVSSKWPTSMIFRRTKLGRCCPQTLSCTRPWSPATEG